MLKDITRYAQQGFTNAANDECMIALQQDTAAMGIQWATRALAMDDPNKSRVVGKIDWSVPPQGHVPFGGDGYCISAFTKQDPDLLFRILATATSKTEPARRGGPDGADPNVAPGRSGTQEIPLLPGSPASSQSVSLSAPARILLGRRIHHPPYPAGPDRRNDREGRAWTRRRAKPRTS